ncbi:formylglycine-generating enzyme family protein [Aeoliella sp.]|uniref:formylglycine-generating enzyme family protein n=1 Tax=Aeoliella sp. TaxID=2795800 RepID=UPI003CCB9ECD
MLQPLLPCQADENSSTLGIVAERPTEGRFVEHNGRFLVPYTTNIPGTEIKFTMIPVPPGKLKVEGEVTYYVELPPFWIGKTEVTWAEYREYMSLDKAFPRIARLHLRKITEENKIDAITAPSMLYEPDFTHEVGERGDQPAVSMRQYAAKQYTKWLSLISGEFYRLPSEAEWTYAARAGATTRYCFGDDESKLDEYAWYADNTEDTWQTGSVGTKAPNRWGIHDMHGNVAEWVLDGDSGKLPTVKPDEQISVEKSIRWPTNVFGRKVMGGGLWDEAADCTCTSFHLSKLLWLANDPDVPASPGWLCYDEGLQVGFRIVRPYKAPQRTERERYWEPQVAKIKNDVALQLQNYRMHKGIADPMLPRMIKQLPEED